MDGKGADGVAAAQAKEDAAAAAREKDKGNDKPKAKATRTKRMSKKQIESACHEMDAVLGGVGGERRDRILEKTRELLARR